MAETSNFNKSGKKPVVLLSPLDWGLGHTARCIPIVQELLNHGCIVIIACNSVQKALLSQEFPDCTYVNLQGYDLRYGTNRWRTIVNILLQAPKILTKIKAEHRWLNIFLKKQPVDAIISDNRFGFYSTSAPTVFITHQLHIKTALGSYINQLVQWLNYRCIARFNACWVPDYKGLQAMAGELSNPARLPAVPVQYLGGISRLQTCTKAAATTLLIILSGPEPQRTQFEDQLLQDIKQLSLRVVLVRGLPESTSVPEGGSNCTIYNHAPASLLNKLLCEAELVISRAGYTTVMDLLKLGKKSILVPTPGQAEQEYLSKHLHLQQLIYTVPQAGFSLARALKAARQFPYRMQPLPMDGYKMVVQEFVQSISR